MLWPNVLKLYTSSKPLLSLTCMKNDIPKMANINITKKSNKQMLNSAGSDMANANSNVRIPLAPLTKRNTRPTFATRTTRRSVGDTKYFSMISLRTRPERNKKICCLTKEDVVAHIVYMKLILLPKIERMTTTKSNKFHGSIK